MPTNKICVEAVTVEDTLSHSAK